MELFSLIKEHLDNSEVTVLPAIEATEKYGRTTFSTSIKLDAAIVVTNESDIPVILQLANKHHFHIYPISSGNNWGYGSIQDITVDNYRVVLDLGQLKGIYPTNKELGLITVQPGVTQQALYDFLKEHDWNYMTPVTGAGPNCCILSNALERGYGITPRTDHFMAINALKAYLPHPDLCQTLYQSAISELDNTSNDFIDKTFKWGLGPYIDGLFTQSNLGIVTEVTVRLAPQPEKFSSFYLKISDENNFDETVILIRDFLKDYEGIVGSINLMDKRRLISMTAQNPNGTDTHKTMSQQQVTNIAQKKRLPEWIVVGSIYGSRSIVKSVKNEFKRRAKKLGNIYFSDSIIVNLAKKILKLPLPNLPFLVEMTEQLRSLNEGQEIMLGKPNQVALPLAYWRNPRVSPDKNKTLLPDVDQCGLLWYAPLLPMEPQTLTKFVAFIRHTTPKYGIEPLITFTNLRHDCIDSTVPIVFDLHNEQATQMAHQCLDELITKGRELGFVPYRLDNKQQSKLNKNSIFWKTVSLIKQSIDPNNIISPGRYNP